MAIFDWMANLAIDAAGGSKSVFGDKPAVADYVPTDLGVESKRAISENTANMPEILALLEKVLPGYGEMVKAGSKNTLSLLRGEIPEDVQDAIYRSGATRAFRGGYGGSKMAAGGTARDLGLTSLGLMEKGENSAQRWAGLTEGAVQPFTITGKDQAEMTMRNNLYEQAVKQFQFNVDAAPDPGAAGLFNTIATIGSMAASFGLGAAGGAMGGSRVASANAGSGYGNQYPSAAGYPTANASGTAPYGWPGWG